MKKIVLFSLLCLHAYAMGMEIDSNPQNNTVSNTVDLTTAQTTHVHNMHVPSIADLIHDVETMQHRKQRDIIHNTANAYGTQEYLQELYTIQAARQEWCEIMLQLKNRGAFMNQDGIKYLMQKYGVE